MSIPGAYTSSDREADSDEDFTYSRALADQAIVDALIGEGEGDTDDQEDDDFLPNDARQLWEDDQEDSEDDSLDEDLEGGEVIIEEEEEIEEEVEGGEDGQGGGEEDGPFNGATQIGYDRKYLNRLDYWPGHSPCDPSHCAILSR